MTPQVSARGVWAPLAVVMVAWLAAGFVLSQGTSADTQPAQPAPAKTSDNNTASEQKVAQAEPDKPEPVAEQEQSAPASAPSTSPATQETLAARASFREMQEAAAKNGALATTRAARAETQPSEGESTDDEDDLVAKSRKRREEARRKLMEEREQMQEEREKAKLIPPAPIREAGPFGSTKLEPGRAASADASDEGPRATRLGSRVKRGDKVPADKTPEGKPVEPPPPSADGRDYFISFDAMAWEDIVPYYAKLVGKPLMPTTTFVSGELTYVSERRFTKEEMLDELNFLLIDQNAYVIETEDYVYLIPLNEMSKYLPIDRMYDTIEAFTNAELRDLQFCEVLIKIDDRPATEIRDMLSPSMPDYALPVVVGVTNKIKIVGLARDVRRFQSLLNVVETREYDPRTTRFIKVETNVRQIEQMVRDYFKVSQAQRQYNRTTKKFETVGGESPILIIPDERTKNLIVKATPAKLEEIEKFIKEIDQKPDIGEFKTTVLPVQHGSAPDIATLLNQILQQEQGQSRRTPTRPTRTTTRTRNTRGRQPTRTNTNQPQAAPEDIIVEDLYERAKKTVRIVADARTNNLVVYANEDGLKRVQEILEQIDKPISDNFQTFKLEYADAQEIQPTVEQIARGIVGGGTRGRSGPTIIADDGLNAIHVLADREHMARIEQIIREFDVEGAQDQWHYVELKNITASEAAGMIAPVLQSGGGRSQSRGRRGSARAAATSQTIPLDEANTLIVICTDDEWEKAEQILNIADEKAMTTRPQIDFFPVENGNAESIAATVLQLYGNYQHPVLGRSRSFVDTIDDKIVVQAVRPALDEIGGLVKSLDLTPDDKPLVILPLQYADASQVAQVAMGLLPPNAGGRRGRPGPGASVQADPAINALIIKADKLTVDRIKAFAADMEKQVSAQKPERRYYTLKNATPRDVVSAISQLFGATGGSRGGRRGGPIGTQVKTVIVGNQVVVDAPAGKQNEIAALVERLDELSDRGITTLLIKMPGADIRSIAGRLSSAFRDRIRTQGVIARFEPDPSTESILMTVSKDVLAEAEDLLKQFKELTSEHVWQTEFYQLKHATANEASRWLLDQLRSLVTQQIGSNAARQLKVTGDQRTNKVIINAPQVAVKQGLELLKQYDQPSLEQPQPIEMWTVKLPGLDVRNLASQLQRQLNELTRNRPDRLRATVSADQLTSNLILSSPRDMKTQIDELVEKFFAETAGLEPVQTFIQVKNADANYVSSLLRTALDTSITRTRGRDVAQRVAIQVDSRLNRIILNAPKFAIAMAEALVAELDQPPTTESQLQTIPLENADANTVNGVLRTIFSEKLRARTLTISVEPLTNSLIVGGAKEDYEDIRQWAEKLDADAAESVAEQKVIPLKGANPWEINTVLQQTFVQKRHGVKVPPGKEVKINIIAGRNILVTAPPEKMKEIEALIATLDEVGANKAMVRTYELPGIGARINDFARQVQSSLDRQRSGQEDRITITPYAPADALIVTAREEQFEQVEQMMEQLKPLMATAQAKTEFFQLEFVDAAQIVNLVRDLVQKRTQAGGKRGSQDFSVSADPRTNRLIVFAPESIMPDVKAVVAELDVEVDDTDVVSIELQYADPWETRNVINDIFGGRGARRGQAQTEQVYVTVSNNTLIVKAPPKKLEQIKEFIATVDAPNPNELQIKMYDLNVLNASVVAGQVQMFLASSGGNYRRGEMRPGAFPETTTNTLVVLAPADKLPFIDTLIAQLEAKRPDEAITRTFVLKNARADQIQRHVDQMLKVKVAEKEGQIRGRRTQQTTAVMADTETNRLFVVAPDEYQELAAELIRMMDTEVDTGEIIHIIPLENGDAAQVAQTVTQTMTGGGRPGRGAAPMKVKVTPDAGSNSIILSGLPRDVAEVEKLVTDLEAASDSIPELQYFSLDYALAYEVADAIRGIFPPTRSVSETVTVSEDEYYNRLLVTANKRKMRQVEAVVSQLDMPPDEEGEFGLGGKEINFVEIFRGDAYSIAWDVSDLFPSPDRGGPTIEADLFEPYIKVVCRPSEFEKIEKLIRQFDNRAKPDIVIRAREFLGDKAQLLQYIQARGLAIDIVEPPPGEDKESIIIDLHPEEDEERTQTTPAPSPRTQVEPPRGDSDGRAPYQPVVVPRVVSSRTRLAPSNVTIQGAGDCGGERFVRRTRLAPLNATVDTLAEAWSPYRPAIVRRTHIRPTNLAAGEEGPMEGFQRVSGRTRLHPVNATANREQGTAIFGGAPSAFGGAVFTGLFQDAVDKAEESAAADNAKADKKEEQPPLERQRASVQMLPDGRVLLSGPRDSVEEIEDAIDLFEEDLSAGEVIRIFKFRHGDVNAASRILDMMFNERTVRAPQQRQQPQQQRGQRGGQEGDDRNSQQNLMQQAMQMMGSRGGQQSSTTGGTKIRIATDASHNYLIVKCDEALLPDIIQLLRELDIAASEVDVEVIQLKNLEASETAANIKEVLGIGRSGTRAAQQPSSRGRNPQQQLMQMLQQQMVSIGSGESAKIESVEIVPNSITNSLLVSAPPEVMVIIRDVIQRMEGLEGGDVTVIKHYPLENAKVDDVLPLLQELFGAAGGGGGRAPGRRAGGGSPADLGQVTISGDPRNNTIIYVAQAKDVDTVKEQIAMLDIEGAIAEVEMYVCKYGDATGIASVVSEMFMNTGRGGGGRRNARGGAATGAMNEDIRITAEPATNTILVFAPLEKRELILEQIETLDRQNRLDIREIQLLFAKPDKVADKLIQIYGGTGGSAMSGGGGRRGGRQAVAQTQGRIVVLGDDATKKLLVRAPDEIFEEMQELVILLDQQSERLQVRRFTLKHADATAVVDSVKSAMMEFMQLNRQLGGEDMGFDAFTAVADPRTNSVLVVGSEETFVFVQSVINEVDGDVPPEQQKQFRMFVLDHTDAQTVADAINQFAGGGAAQGGRGGGRRGMAASSMGGGATIDVQAVAEPATNAVMVYGRPIDIDLVEETFINELEGAVSTHNRFETISIKQAVPTQLITYIQPFLDQISSQGGGASGGRRNAGVNASPGARLIGNDVAKTITVYGSNRQIREVQDLVARFDNDTIEFNQHAIIPVPWGQDAYALANMVQGLVNESEQIDADRTGRQARLVTVQADEHSNSIVAFGEPTQLAIVKTLLQQLQTIRPETPVTRIINLENLSASEAVDLINDMQQQRGSSGSSIRRSTPSRSGGSSNIRRSSGGSSPRRSTPSRSGGSRRRGWNGNMSYDGVRFVAADVPVGHFAPAGFATPFVSAASFSPVLQSVMLLQTAPRNQAIDQPPEDKPPVVESEVLPRPEEPPARLQKGLSSITGQLRGEVAAQALDSRRIVVVGDQDDVEFIVQMLALMEGSTPAPVIEVFDLQSSKAAAIAPVLEETVNAMNEIRDSGDRVDKFSIVAEARSNTLIVSASETNMEMIRELVAKLDIATDTENTVKLVPLKHIRAAEAFDLLEPTIQRLNEIRQVPADAQPTISAVDRSNAIQIVGTPKDISEIEQMLEGVDVELAREDDFGVATMLVIDLKNADAEDLAETLTTLIEVERSGKGAQGGGDSPLLRKLFVTTADGREMPPINLDKPIMIIPEKGKNSLIVFSNKENGEALQEVVALFDSLPVGEEVEVKSIVLLHANAEQVADLLEQMFDDAKKAIQRPSRLDKSSFESGVLPPVPPGLAGRGLPYNVAISHDARSNTVIVIGRKDAVLLAVGLVTELDKPATDLTLKAHILQLRNVQATTLKEKLDEMLSERLDALGSDKNEARDSAIITADDRSNTLVIHASDDVFNMVNDLAMQLDGAEPYSVVDSQFRRLTYADAAKLAGLLQELFDKKKDADRDVTDAGQKNILYVFADGRSNSLMLTGTRDYLTEANSLVDQLDQSYDPTVQFSVRPVRLNSAANIAQLLKDMIEESRSGQDNEMQGTPIHVAADPYSNNLLLAAAQEDMEMLERWIEVLDRPSEPGRVTRIIPLTRGDAQELASSAQDLFGASASGAEDDVTVTHDETTNSVIAIGPPAVVNDIEKFIDDWNNVEGAGAIVRIFKLAQADAEDAGELLRNILEGRGGSVGGGSTSGGASEEMTQVMLIFQSEHPEIGLETLKGMRSDIVVADDLRTNSLVVTAPPESMPLMESLVAAVDVPPDAAKIRIFRLRNSDAEEMMTMLEEVFKTEESSSASNADEEVALTMGGMAAGGRQHLAFSVDTRTNSVIAAGTTGYLDLVDELILQLDSQPIEDRKVFVYEPRNNPAEAIQQVINEYSDTEEQRLNELSDEISVDKRQERVITAIASEDTNRLLLDYDPRRENEVLELVRDLDQPPPQVMIQVLIVEVTMDNSLELGVEFAFQDLQYTKAGPTDTTTFDFVGGTDIGAAGTGLGGFTFTITGADFNFLMRTLQNEGALNVLQRPQIVAMDNQEATIKITNDVPYVAGSTVTATGLIQSNVQRREVGIELTVTPHINPDGFVRMEILQTVSDITGSTIDVGNGLTSPIFLDREAETVVTVKDNETVVLGGLITTRDERREQKVPLLGDIPLLGWLARNDSVDSSRNELLVILTPRIVRTVEDYQELSAQERDRTGILPEEVLTSEMMNKLRVRPENVTPREDDDMLGPFPKSENEKPAEELDEEIYGPLPKSSPRSMRPRDGRDDVNSYDVPISWRDSAADRSTRRVARRR